MVLGRGSHGCCNALTADLNDRQCPKRSLLRLKEYKKEEKIKIKEKKNFDMQSSVDDLSSVDISCTSLQEPANPTVSGVEKFKQQNRFGGSKASNMS